MAKLRDDRSNSNRPNQVTTAAWLANDDRACSSASMTSIAIADRQTRMTGHPPLHVSTTARTPRRLWAMDWMRDELFDGRASVRSTGWKACR
jgi:hypothetical protein